MKVELAVIVNQNGMFIIGIKPKNVLSKNLPVLVQPDNILLIILLHEVRNAIVSRIMCSIHLKVFFLNITFSTYSDWNNIVPVS